MTSQEHASGEDLDRLIALAQPQPDWVVLDVATGGGHTALKFAPQVRRVIATDITPSMLQAARDFMTQQGVGNVVFELADAENLPFQDATFDLVTCRIAAHHFPDCPRFLQESTRVLKNDGLLIVQDHVLPQDSLTARCVEAFEKLRDPSHHQAYTQTQWVDMFQKARLRVEHTEQIVKEHHFLTWAQRQGCTPQVIEELIQMVQGAPVAVLQWMVPRDFGKEHATFANHHVIIAGRK